MDLENNLHFTAADYAYSFSVQDHLKGKLAAILMVPICNQKVVL